jgi:hypothetical protein
MNGLRGNLVMNHSTGFKDVQPDSFGDLFWIHDRGDRDKECLIKLGIDARLKLQRFSTGHSMNVDTVSTTSVKESLH